MAENTNIPVALGGLPVRAERFRTTPEVGIAEVLYTAAQINSRDWEPDARHGGLPVLSGLTPPAPVAESLGAEQAALAAEFVAMQAPDQPDVVAVPADNGTHVIRIALMALTALGDELGLRRPNVDGDEVIVPAATWQATAGAPLRRNLVPVLADVLPGTLCLDPEAVRSLITERTVAIIPVHLYNRMAELETICEIAREHGIAVIEDCAHAQGAVYSGKGAGTLGIAGTFSMQGSKSLSSQEGGLILASNPALVEQLCSIVTCGRKVGSSKTLQADNDRMAGVVAALARAQLTRFVEQNDVRVRTFRELDVVAEELPGIRPLDSQPGVDVPPTYKWAFRVEPSEWQGLTLDGLAACLEQELHCEVARIYVPLVNSPLYQPHSDPALRISEEHWQRIDPSRHPAPWAMEAYESVLVLEHAVGLDPAFPAAFAEAVRKLHAHADRLARQL